MNSQWFVGSLAIGLAAVLSWNAVSFTPLFYELKTVAAVEARFGRRAACGFLLGISAVLITTGILILSGVRPAYATVGAGRDSQRAPSSRASSHDSPSRVGTRSDSRLAVTPAAG